MATAVRVSMPGNGSSSSNSFVPVPSGSSKLLTHSPTPPPAATATTATSNGYHAHAPLAPLVGTEAHRPQADLPDVLLPGATPSRSAAKAAAAAGTKAVSAPRSAAPVYSVSSDARVLPAASPTSPPVPMRLQFAQHSPEATGSFSGKGAAHAQVHGVADAPATATAAVATSGGGYGAGSGGRLQQQQTPSKLFALPQKAAGAAGHSEMTRSQRRRAFAAAAGATVATPAGKEGRKKRSKRDSQAPEGMLKSAITADRKTRTATIFSLRGLASSSPKRKNRSSKGQDLVKTLNLLDTLNETQKKRIRKAFDTYDVDGSGFITAKDLRPLLRYLGDNPTSTELQDLIIWVDADGNGVIDYDEFITLIVIRSRHKHTEQQLIDAFKMFDDSGTGFLSIKRLQHAMKHLIDMDETRLNELLQVATEISKEGVEEGVHAVGVVDYERLANHIMTAY